MSGLWQFHRRRLRVCLSGTATRGESQQALTRCPRSTRWECRMVAWTKVMNLDRFDVVA
jgi:hypothetical protein